MFPQYPILSQAFPYLSIQRLYTINARISASISPYGYFEYGSDISGISDSTRVTELRLIKPVYVASTNTIFTYRIDDVVVMIGYEASTEN